MRRTTTFQHQGIRTYCNMEEGKSNVLVELVKNSTPEQRKEAQAIAKFVSRMMSLSPESTLEEQMKSLDNFYGDEETKHTREEMAPYMVEYIDRICQNYYDRNKENFEKLEEKQPYAIVVGLIMADYIFTADHSKLDTSVVTLYHKYVEDYRTYVEDIIVNQDRYELTVNQEDIFKKYLKFRSDYKESQKEVTFGQMFGSLNEHIDKYIPIIKELQAAGLDKNTVDYLVSEVLVNQYLMVAAGLCQDTIRKVGRIGNMTDDASIQKYISAGERIAKEMELSEAQIRTINNGTDLLKKVYPPSSGCLGAFIAIISISSTLICLIGWGLSSLFT